MLRVLQRCAPGGGECGPPAGWLDSPQLSEAPRRGPALSADYLAIVATMQARAARIEARFDAIEAEQRHLGRQLAAALAALRGRALALG